MPRLPFVGRLLFSEYVALIGSLLLVGLEVFVRVITLALPIPILRIFYNWSASIFNRFSRPQGERSRAKKKTIVNQIRDASDFVDMCALFGYYAEEHIVQTGDGYLLGLHRLGWRKGEEGTRVNSGENSIKKPVVYLHHGIMMNSEVWICITDTERSLPIQLVERGYDVWLGNNRGNKYSKKSIHHSPASVRFWDFSIDQFAFHDIPDSISYILSTTSRPTLSYIGFSQGTAQAFAALSIHPTLNDQVDVFIALAPAMSPAGLSNSIVDSLIKASPDVIFLAFGRRSILSSATMWQAILYPPLFVRIIDMSLSFLFNWHSRNISLHQKLAAYPHLYSFTSTKSVVHWFQIIRTKSFQMYDDESAAIFSVGAGAKYSKKHKFPTRNIKTPIMLVYGGSDSLVEIDIMLRELPAHTVVKEIPHFEHLDFLWGNEVDRLVHPLVFDALGAYATPIDLGLKKSPRKAIEYHVTQPPRYIMDDLANGDVSNTSSAENFDDAYSININPRRLSGVQAGLLTTSPTSQQQPTKQSEARGVDNPSLSAIPSNALSTKTADQPKSSDQSKESAAPSESSWLSTLRLRKEKKVPSTTTERRRPHSMNEADFKSDSPSSRATAVKRKRPQTGSPRSPQRFEDISTASLGSSPVGLSSSQKPGFGADGISLGRAKAVGGTVSQMQDMDVGTLPDPR